jgi:hypothetical protein
LAIEAKPEWESAVDRYADKLKLQRFLGPPRGYAFAFFMSYTDRSACDLSFQRIDLSWPASSKFP